MKKLIKILPILMVVLTILTACAPVLANATIAGVQINPATNSAGNVAGIGNNILGIIRVIGTVIAVGIRSS